MRNDILEKKDEILKMISENESKANICKNLNCKTDTLQFYLKKWNIEYKGNQGLKNKNKYTGETSYLEYTEGGKSISAHQLKLKLIKQGVKKHKCEICNLTEWNGLIIPIELHHINGNHFDNSLDNLMILCPNCHSQTGSNSGANVGTKTK